MADLDRAQSEVEHYIKELKRVSEELSYWTKELNAAAREERSRAQSGNRNDRSSASW